VVSGKMSADCDLETGVLECGCRRDGGRGDSALSGMELAGVAHGASREKVLWHGAGER
jgi:hypothetical protein